MVGGRIGGFYDRNVRITRPSCGNATQVETHKTWPKRTVKPVKRYNMGVVVCCVCKKSFREIDTEHYDGQVICSIKCFKQSN